MFLLYLTSRLDWDRWIMMGLIGTTIGFIGFLMHQSVHLIAEIKWEKTNHFIHVSNISVDLLSDVCVRACVRAISRQIN